MFLRRARPVSPAVPPVPRAARRRSDVAVLPTVPLLQQILDEYGLLHAVDADGDLVVRWERCNVYFFFYGEHDEVLQARVYLNRRHDVELRPAIMAVLDDWNRTKLFPKAYTVLPDDGMVGVCGEQSHDFEGGVTRDQLRYTVGAWAQTMLRFADWVDEQL